MRRKKVIIIGVVFFISIFLFFWGFNYLKGKSVFNKQQVYYSIYENVRGLNIGSPVIFKGFKVGIIDKIEFSDDIGSKVIVTIFIDKNFKIPKGSKAQIYNADLLGTKGLRISPSNSLEYYASGDTIKSSVELSMVDEITKNFGPLKDKTEDLVLTIDTAISILNRIIINNENNLNTSFKNISQITSDLESFSKTLRQMTNEPDGQLYAIISDLESVSSTLRENQPQLNNAINNFSDISDSLASANIKNTLLKTSLVMSNLSEITSKMNNGEGTIGQLIENDSLYIYLEDLTLNLNNLVKDIQLNPRKYLRISAVDLSKNTNK